MQINILVLYGYGINCDNETEQGFKMVGGNVKKVHINELISGEKKLKNYQILVFPGGFSFGDDISAGKVLANKFKYNLWKELTGFINNGKLIIGICNGFQVMVKLGILPAFDRDYGKEKITLTFNDSGRFEDRWVYLKINQESNCIWTQGINNLYLPIRHGEGKFVLKDKKIGERLSKQNQVVMQYVDDKGNLAGYPFNPNGSENNIAGICDKTGRIFGLMPHPEGFLFYQNHPRWTRKEFQENRRLKIFKNAVEFAKNKL